MLAHGLFLSFLTLLIRWTEASNYQENLLLRPLPQSSLLATFDFKSNTTLSDFEEQNYNVFPRSLGQILRHTHTKELHLRFSLGRWDADNWGARPRGGRREGGTGVELWAWVEAETLEEANARWLSLSNALSGLFCASLNFIDSTKTIRPESTFDMEGSKGLSGDLHLLHGALPHEVVCTENLTPFLKLLPCKGKAGISTLLDGHKLFDASWQTMAIDVRPVCPSDGSECLVEIEQTVDMVLDIDRSTRPSSDPIPRPASIESIACNTSKPYNSGDTCFPQDRLGERAFSLQEVFGRPIRGSCALDAASLAEPVIQVEVAAERAITVESNGGHHEALSTDGTTRSYQLALEESFDLLFKEHDSRLASPLDHPLLYAERTFTGHGQERGGVHTVLTNPSPVNSVRIVYLESLPWFMKPYLHTLHASTARSPSSANTTTPPTTNPITSLLYRPGIDRQRGSHLELSLTVPTSSSVTLVYDFEKAILRYTEYPPDANRGFDVAPAIIRILPGTANTAREVGGQSTYLRTTSLLLPLPTPDFSMPYNVIILTSTVIAMGFGSIFNLLVRRFVAADEVEGGGLAGVKDRLVVVRERIMRRIKVLLEKIGAGAGEKQKQFEKKVQ